MPISADQLQMVMDTSGLFCEYTSRCVCVCMFSASVFASQIQLFIISSANTVWLFLVSVPPAQVSSFVYYLLCCAWQCLGRTQSLWQSCHCVGVIIMFLHRKRYLPCVAEHCAPDPN